MKDSVDFDPILDQVGRYYTERVSRYGPTARGVDWNSEASQQLRFVQLLKVCKPGPDGLSILDYGCGYGALVGALSQTHHPFQYVGFDISTTMIDEARAAYASDSRCRFTSDRASLTQMDYVLASGIFNVRLQTNDADWELYMRHTLQAIDSLSVRGFAFNALTLYSDPERRRPDLYYADSRFWFDYCRRFSRYVALLHDYPLYEFTVLVTKAV